MESHTYIKLPSFILNKGDISDSFDYFIAILRFNTEIIRYIADLVNGWMDGFGIGFTKLGTILVHI